MGAGCSSDRNAADNKYKQPQEGGANSEPPSHNPSYPPTPYASVTTTAPFVSRSNSNLNGSKATEKRKVPRSVSSILKGSAGEKSAVFKKMTVQNSSGGSVSLDHLQKTLGDDAGVLDDEVALVLAKLRLNSDKGEVSLEQWLSACTEISDLDPEQKAALSALWDTRGRLKVALVELLAALDDVSHSVSEEEGVRSLAKEHDAIQRAGALIQEATECRARVEEAAKNASVQAAQPTGEAAVYAHQLLLGPPNDVMVVSSPASKATLGDVDKLLSSLKDTCPRTALASAFHVDELEDLEAHVSLLRKGVVACMSPGAMRDPTVVMAIRSALVYNKVVLLVHLADSGPYPSEEEIPSDLQGLFKLARPVVYRDGLSRDAALGVGQRLNILAPGSEGTSTLQTVKSLPKESPQASYVDEGGAPPAAGAGVGTAAGAEGGAGAGTSATWGYDGDIHVSPLMLIGAAGGAPGGGGEYVVPTGTLSRHPSAIPPIDEEKAFGDADHQA